MCLILRERLILQNIIQFDRLRYIRNGLYCLDVTDTRVVVIIVDILNGMMREIILTLVVSDRMMRELRQNLGLLAFREIIQEWIGHVLQVIQRYLIPIDRR